MDAVVQVTSDGRGVDSYTYLVKDARSEFEARQAAYQHCYGHDLDDYESAVEWLDAIEELTKVVVTAADVTGASTQNTLTRQPDGSFEFKPGDRA